jgi:hypothetical protein
MVNGRWLFRENAWTTLECGQARQDLDTAHQALMRRVRTP